MAAQTMRRERLEVTTPDGRRLLAETAGPEDGALVIFHTGTPGSRHIFEGHIRACAVRALRIVCFSRPGYDGSDRLPGRSFADCPADTTVVADALGAASFYVIGHSGGGAPALADAALLPHRVRAVAAIAMLAPRSAPGLDWRAGTDLANKEEFDALEAGDAALERTLTAMAREMREVTSGAQIGADFARFYTQVDLDCLSGELLEFMVKSYPLAVRGGIWGWFDDDKALWDEWRFDLAQITVPVSIWQGGEDRIIPTAHGRWLGDHVPGARFHLLPNDGHISSFYGRFDAILDELIALGRAKA